MSDESPPSEAIPADAPSEELAAGQDVSAQVGGAEHRPEGSKAIRPEDDDFDGPPPRCEPVADEEETNEFVVFDGTLASQLEMMCDLATQSYRHSKRSFDAADRAEVESDAYKRAINRASRLASTCRQLVTGQADVIKKCGG